MVVVTPMDSVLARVEAEKSNEESKKKLLEVMEYLKRTGELVGVNLNEKYVYETGNVKVNQGFLLDTTLKKNIDNFLVKAVANLWDGIFILSGMEGSMPSRSKVLMADGEWKNIEDVNSIMDIAISKN